MEAVLSKAPCPPLWPGPQLGGITPDSFSLRSRGLMSHIRNLNPGLAPEEMRPQNVWLWKPVGPTSRRITWLWSTEIPLCKHWYIYSLAPGPVTKATVSKALGPNMTEIHLLNLKHLSEGQELESTLSRDSGTTGGYPFCTVPLTC